jgi:hypothetical protein
MRLSLYFGVPKVPGVQLVLRSSSPGLTVYSAGPSHGAPQDPGRRPALPTSG